ncbi:MAG: adenosylcobinamide-GDP ribazoletransferase [Actinomycetota bacterium]|nr:adenosylcobinamide-GDP ribazoletransferase [Actinomycetota bacterium]MDP2289072.1 adenosylcobinamide-GDP ribazoletransferase [Actinomycetota bacterium]
MPDALRLAIGTLTRLPVPAPRTLTRSTTTWAMSLAPLIGAALALVCGLPLLIEARQFTTLVLAAISIALLAFATRALHLDGLADTADALGSAKPAQQALEIARKSDIGPFGVIALVLNLLLQTFALAACLYAGDGLPALVLAAVLGRIALTWACTQLWPAARADGLGASVAGSVPLAVPILWAVVIAIGGYVLLGAAGVLATLLALLAGQLVLMITKRRLGGVTGDVLGAVIECATSTALITLALLLQYSSF